RSDAHIRDDSAAQARRAYACQCSGCDRHDAGGVRTHRKRCLYYADAIASRDAHPGAPLGRVGSLSARRSWDGLRAAALAALCVGSSIHCCETFSPRSFDQALRDYAPTWLTAAPALHIAMKDYYAGQKSTPSIRTLRCFRSSSAPLAPASIARLEELYAAPLLETYGLTETASTLCSNRLPPGKRKPGSVGQAISADLKIVDPHG